jgi:cation:H+ antiporter
MTPNRPALSYTCSKVHCGGTRHERKMPILLWIGFFIIAAVIVYSGTRLSRYGDVIAERTGLGRTWIGVLLMASVTSLPELCTGVSSAMMNLPDIAVGDVLGSCVFNLVILASLDLVEREKTISAKAHHGHVLSAGFGILLLSLIGISIYGRKLILPFGWIGFYSLIIMAIYLFAMRMVYSYEKREIARFIGEQAEELKYEGITLKSAVRKFSLNALVVIAAAIALPSIGAGIAQMTGLGQTFVGNIFVAFATSLPEVVISLAAVKIGAIDLAIGNLLGSNIFNIFILAIDDVFFVQGPILSFASENHMVSVLASIAMTAVMIVGLTYRSEKKILFMAWDSLVVVFLYFSYVMLLYMYR